VYPFDLNKIPKGLCQCGCGGTTNTATDNHYKCGYKRGEPLKFIHGHNKAHWKGGKSNSNGYNIIYNPEHPKADAKGYVYEHILVCEKVLGKFLPPKAVVHHVDGNTKNNEPDNLVVCQNQSYHLLLHRRERKNKLKNQGE
jgi:hypothetical protein